jgi:hypothetical protein
MLATPKAERASDPRKYSVVVVGGFFLVMTVALWPSPDPGEARLRAFVHARPPVPIVFTSRSSTASFVAAAPDGLALEYPGQPLWAAAEGRLRLLTPRGTVHELTWGKRLPCGGTLIDVMSPSVRADGRKIIFAGRKAPPDSGRFRLYEIDVDGHNLRPLTGQADDPGCDAVPPMRFREDGTLIPDEERRRIDYDDIDPAYLPDGRILFVSSRTPDLGRDHARRATNLWVMDADGHNKHPVTANRNNDRWPVVLSSGVVAFSLWSRNREVVTADERDIQPFKPGMPSATLPTDVWMGAALAPVSGRFGMLLKVPVPVWRPRPLFNGRLVFMTPASPGVLRVLQADADLIANAPSTQRPDATLPHGRPGQLSQSPDRDAFGRQLSLATPSPCPNDGIVLSVGSIEESETYPKSGCYGIGMIQADWQSEPATKVEMLFDDPDLVDAEPVAIYPRLVAVPGREMAPKAPHSPSSLELASGIRYQGPVGLLQNVNLYQPGSLVMPGQRTDTDKAPIFDAPPVEAIDHLRIYASRRDRFDDPVRARVPGEWELLLKVPVQDRQGFAAWLPAGVPTVLVAFDRDGKVTRWSTAATDAEGRQATFYGIAGDHYSAIRPSAYNFCVGCHPGHSSLAILHHAEQRAP